MFILLKLIHIVSPQLIVAGLQSKISLRKILLPNYSKMPTEWMI